MLAATSRHIIINHLTSARSLTYILPMNEELKNLAPQRQKDGIFGYFAYHRTAAHLLLLAMLVLGFYSASKIKVQFFPDVEIEAISVSYNWEGAGAKDIDNSITNYVEPVLLTLDNLERLDSVSREGALNITMLFEDGADMDALQEDIKSRLNALNNLPSGIDQPTLNRAKWTDRVTDIVLYGDVSLELLQQYADQLNQKLQQNDVTNVTIRGDSIPKLRIEITQKQLLEHHLNLSDVQRIIKQQMTALPSGDISDGNTRVRTGVNRKTIEALNDIVIKAKQNGEKILLGDMAHIYYEAQDNNTSYYYKESPAVPLRIRRNSGGDTLKIHEIVKETVGEFQQQLPEAIKVKFTNVRAQPIIDRIGILIENSMFSLSLVMIILFLFLSAHTAFWIAAGLPAAFGAAFILLYFMGFSLNMISLFALIICLGIAVDDAIVIGEHSDFLHQRGASPYQAAVWSPQRMFMPVLTASATTIIAFLSLSVVSGRFGKLFSDLHATVIIVVAASLVECFLILPAHMRHSLAKKNYHKIAWYDQPSHYVNKAMRFVSYRILPPLLNIIIKFKFLIYAIAVTALLYAISFVIDRTVKWRFFNAPERATISASIAMLEGATRADTEKMLNEMERALYQTNEEFAEKYNLQTVQFSLKSLGAYVNRIRGVSPFKQSNLRAGISAELIDPDSRPFASFDFIRAWKKNIKRSPMLEKLKIRGDRSGNTGETFQILLYGEDSLVLKNASENIQQQLRQFPQISGLEGSLSYDKNELSLSLNILGQSLNLNETNLAQEMSVRLKPIELSQFSQNNKNVVIELNMPENERNADFIENAYYMVNKDAYVALSDIIDTNTQRGFSSIVRKDGLINTDITADIDTNNTDFVTEIETRLENEILPAIKRQYDVDYELGGQSAQQKRFIDDAIFGFVACMIGIYILLAWAFSSFTLPAIILAIVPFGGLGMVLGHYIHNVPLSIFSVIGFIGMSGIIINDAIVLISTINEYSKFRALREAVIAAICDRFRPVFLTTATTVIGLIPLILEKSSQAQFLLPAVLTLAYGLGIGMFIVLILVPAMVLMVEDVKRYSTSVMTLFKILTNRRYRRMRKYFSP